jgi:hypothetical protein
MNNVRCGCLYGTWVTCMTYLDFAVCRCGFRTPIQPSMTATKKEAGSKMDRTGEELSYVACGSCRRIYKPLALEIGPSSDGLSPFHRNAPLHVFREFIECTEELTCLPITILAVRKADTNAEELGMEKNGWSGTGLKCARGHLQSYPSGLG